MTTAWSYCVRGRFVSAWRANAGGALLALVAAVGGPWLALSGLAGRWLVTPPHENWFFGSGLVLVCVTLVQWAGRISWGW